MLFNPCTPCCSCAACDLSCDGSLSAWITSYDNNNVNGAWVPLGYKADSSPPVFQGAFATPSVEAVLVGIGTSLATPYNVSDYRNTASWIPFDVPSGFNGITGMSILPSQPTGAGFSFSGKILGVRGDTSDPVKFSTALFPNLTTPSWVDYATACCGNKTIAAQFPLATTLNHGTGTVTPGATHTVLDGSWYWTYGLFPDFGFYSPGRALVVTQDGDQSFVLPGDSEILPTGITELNLTLSLGFNLFPSDWNTYYFPSGPPSNIPLKVTGTACIDPVAGTRVMHYRVSGFGGGSVNGSLVMAYGLIEVAVDADDNVSVSAAIRVRTNLYVTDNYENIPFLDVCLMSQSSGWSVSGDPFAINVPMYIPSLLPNSFGTSTVATISSS